MFESIKNIFIKKEKVMTQEQDTLLREQFPANVEGSEEFDTAVLEETKEVWNESYNLYSSPEVSGWMTKEEQQRAFLASMLFVQSTHSVLDVGCGRCDFYEYIQSIYPGQTITYKGIDYNPNLLNIAREKYEGIQVSHTDLLSDESEEKFDWVIANKIFDLNTQIQPMAYMIECIEKMYEKANYGVIFNLTYDYPETIAEEDKQYVLIHDPAYWLTYLINRYTKVLSRTDYTKGEITFFIIK